MRASASMSKAESKAKKGPYFESWEDFTRAAERLYQEDPWKVSMKDGYGR